MLSLPIETDRLRLRRATPADAEDVYAYQRLPEVVRYLYRPPWTWEQTRDAVAAAGSAAFADEGDELRLVVERKDEPGVIGEALLKWASGPARQGEVGYVFHPDQAGHGYATEAARAMLDVGFETIGFHRIFARVDAENTGSAAVCRRLGMRQEAHLLENGVRDGEWGSELVFALLRREWRVASG